MTDKHTPGPWHLKVDGSGIMRIKTAGGTSLMSNSNYGYPPAYEADWHLIAAAPDNYECNIELAAIVRELCAVYNHPLPQASLDRSDAAIAKARGDK